MNLLCRPDCRHKLAALLVVWSSLAGRPAGADPGSGTPAEMARQILEQTGVRGGLVVHVGCGDGRLTAALRAHDGYLVHGLDADPAMIEKARRHLQLLGLYGPVSVDTWTGPDLPYHDNLVNLVVAEDPETISMTEIMRVLAPQGVAWVRRDGQWTKTVKPRPDNIDEWTHYLHDPSNNAVAHDDVIAPLRRMQWLAGPLYSRHHDHMSGASAMVTANGRLFYIFEEAPRASVLIPPEWFLYARDAFNGTLLWKRAIGPWHEHLWPLKSGPQLLTRRLVAVGDRVYVTLGIDAPLTALDAATGATLRTYEGSRATEEILCHDGVLFLSLAEEGQPLRSEPKRSFRNLAEIRAAVTDPLWTEAPRTVTAIETDTGKVLWKRESPVVSMSLAADAKRVLFHDGERIQCLDRQDGRPLWASEPLAKREGMRSSGGVTLVLCDEVVLYSGQVASSRPAERTTTMVALSAQDGHTLWQAPHPPCGHMGTPDDILVLNGVVWCGAVAQGTDSGVMTGRDLRTGKVLKEFPPDVETHWFHHRCYRAKATDNYLLFSRTGIEFIDVDQSHWTPHHWVRGACLYGLMPANGLVYNPPHPCACYAEAKLSGFNALAPALATPLVPTPASARLVRGPAYDQEIALAQAAPDPARDWPTYRGNAARSGSIRSGVPADLTKLWQADLASKPSPLTVAEGKLYVAQPDTHTVQALDAASGRLLWSFTAGGRVDSPPTLWRGRALFGSRDGHVYCLRAADGTLIWRFQAAMADRRHVAFDQLESAWPVHGSVLIHHDTVYAVAGRSMFLDGGLRLVRLNPESGALLGETVLDDRDPGSDDNLQGKIQGLNMPVALPDILSCDGNYVYMRSLPFDLEGRRKFVEYVPVKAQQGDDVHLFSPTGFLDDTQWHRTYWVYGRAWASGAGGYYQAGRLAPAGRLMVFDDTTVWGYGRRWQYYRWSTPYVNHLFATKKQPDIIRMSNPPPPQNDTARNRRRGASNQTPVTRFAYQWTDELPVQVCAMVLAGPTLFVAGPPEVVNEDEAFKSLDDPKLQAQLANQRAAYEGRQGAILTAVSAQDGKGLASFRLPAMPVFDGMAAAAGKLYVATVDGQVHCLGAGPGQPLEPAPNAMPRLRPPDADQPLANTP